MHKTQTSRNIHRRENLLRWPAKAAEPPLVVQRVNRILDSNFVDLDRVADEIRAHSDLESLVLRISISLSLSPVDSWRTLEDAVFALGGDRLRVLLYTWSLIKRKAIRINAPHAPGKWGPEALYLASFLRYLGLDSPDAAILHSEMFPFALDPQRREFADLRDTLMRDFLALIPTLDPSILRLAPETLAKT